MYRFFAVIFFLLFKNAMLLEAPPEKPNFIIILTDDQGWADFSANSPNSNLQTPNLDKLVRAGANFTNAYTSAPQCVPTRAGLLLGKVQNKLEIEKKRRFTRKVCGKAEYCRVTFG
jgi:arylsulfatase A-like enzyme